MSATKTTVSYPAISTTIILAHPSVLLHSPVSSLSWFLFQARSLSAAPLVALLGIPNTSLQNLPYLKIRVCLCFETETASTVRDISWPLFEKRRDSSSDSTCSSATSRRQLLYEKCNAVRNMLWAVWSLFTFLTAILSSLPKLRISFRFKQSEGK